VSNDSRRSNSRSTHPCAPAPVGTLRLAKPYACIAIASSSPSVMHTARCVGEMACHPNRIGSHSASALNCFGSLRYFAKIRSSPSRYGNISRSPRDASRYACTESIGRPRSIVSHSSCSGESLDTPSRVGFFHARACGAGLRSSLIPRYASASAQASTSESPRTAIHKPMKSPFSLLLKSDHTPALSPVRWTPSESPGSPLSDPTRHS
jgi:hypothetical protein